MTLCHPSGLFWIETQMALWSICRLIQQGTTLESRWLRLTNCSRWMKSLLTIRCSRWTLTSRSSQALVSPQPTRRSARTSRQSLARMPLLQVRIIMQICCQSMKMLTMKNAHPSSLRNALRKIHLSRETCWFQAPTWIRIRRASWSSQMKRSWLMVKSPSAD